jgi:nicotinate-nucleotide adenylyltransferase
MKIGLYFGSFNPIHVGHLIIAQYMLNNTDLNQIWFVVSPQNPFKEKKSLLEDYHRLALVRLAIDDEERFKAEDIEFKMPKPSYTIDTLTYLQEKHPEYEFDLLMGEDNIHTFHKWKNYEQILRKHKIWVYPRVDSNAENQTNDLLDHASVHFYDDVPVMNISASFIRKQIKKGKPIRYMVTDKVCNYIEEMHFYK